MKKTLCSLLLLMLFSASCASPNPASTGPGTDLNGEVESPVETQNKEPATAYQAYTFASEALSEAESFLIDTEIKMEMPIDGSPVEVAVTGEIAVVMLSETDLQMQMDMSTIVMGMDIATMVYYKDGMYYTDDGTSKTKIAMPIDQALEQANTEPFEFPESAIKEEIVDGNNISFTLDGGAMNDLLMEQMTDLQSLLGYGEEITFSDIHITSTIENGVMKKTDMEFTMNIPENGEETTVNLVMTMDYKQIGGVTIEFPDDLDSYVEAQ